MSPNMGAVDRIIRTLFALVIMGLAMAGVISGPIAIFLGALAIIFLATAIVGYCPLYWPVHFSTRRSKA